jgi:hypothetical protein
MPYAKLRKLVSPGVVIVAGLGLGLLGCSKADPGPSAGFVATDQMHHDPSLPFQRVWRQPGLNWDKYRRLYVAPVNTDYTLAMTEWQQGMRRGEIESDVRKLAVYTQNAIKKAFREDPKRRFAIVEAPGNAPDTLILEVALTEVVPSKIVLNALGHAPYGIGLALSAVRGIAQDKSTVAIEVRGRDAATRQIMFMVADREAQQLAPGNLRGLTWYGHAHQIIDTWAKQFVRVANRDRAAGEVIEDSKPFTLKPW